MSESRRSSASMLAVCQEGDVKKCGWCCKSLPVDRFEHNPKKGAPYSKCMECRPKHAATSNSSSNCAAVKRKYKQTDAGKEAEKRYKSSEKGKEKEKRYKSSEKGKEREKQYRSSEKGKEKKKRSNASESGKAAKKQYRSSEKGKETEKRYKSSESGKDAAKRYRGGAAGRATAKRFVANRASRRRASPAMRLDHAIGCASRGLMSGRYKDSPTFVARTSFASGEEFLANVGATFSEGMTFENHGTAWELDHKIPREAYDFSNPEDVRRCWSPMNVHAMTPEANMQKSWKLVDKYILEAGTGCFPAAWSGRFPTFEIKMEHTATMVARKVVEEEMRAAGELAEDDDEYYSSDDDEEDSDDDSDDGEGEDGSSDEEDDEDDDDDSSDDSD